MLKHCILKLTESISMYRCDFFHVVICVDTKINNYLLQTSVILDVCVNIYDIYLNICLDLHLIYLN